MQLGRLRYQHAEAVKLGVKAALENGKLPRAWFDGIATFAEEADEMYYADAAERAGKVAMGKILKRG